MRLMRMTMSKKPNFDVSVFLLGAIVITTPCLAMFAYALIENASSPMLVGLFTVFFLVTLLVDLKFSKDMVKYWPLTLAETIGMLSSHQFKAKVADLMLTLMIVTLEMVGFQWMIDFVTGQVLPTSFMVPWMIAFTGMVLWLLGDQVHGLFVRRFYKENKNEQ